MWGPSNDDLRFLKRLFFVAIAAIFLAGVFLGTWL